MRLEYRDPGALAIIDAGTGVRFRDLAREAEDIRRTLDRGHPRLLIATNERVTIATAVVCLQEGVPMVFLHPRWPLSEEQRIRGSLGGSRLDDRTAVVFHTSGTTSAPRGVMLSVDALLAAAKASAARLGWCEDDRWLLALPLAHIGGFSIITRCLLAGRTVVLPEPTPSFDPEAIIRSIERDRVTMASFVPTMLHRLLERTPRWDPPSHLRAILLGGAGPSPRVLERARVRAWPVLATYGLTEACSQVATQLLGTPPHPRYGSGPPVDGIELRIVDGEIQIRGPMMMFGYLDDPSPFQEGGWFATGDLGQIDELGCLHILGRKRDLIITGGENVHPMEVERVLESCPQVRAAGVFAAPDEEWGEIVCAAIIPEEGAAENAIKAFIDDHLASFQRPRRIRCVSALPLLPNGKLDRRALGRT
jgi:O-succinylbenzoic acid--CoA ligase